MSGQRIELRAILMREGEVLLLRSPGEPWTLPGGSFDEDADDMDAAMDSLLRERGVAAVDISEAFLRTCYGSQDGARVVINLYAPIQWLGDPEVPAGSDLKWVAPGQLSGAGMDASMLDATLVALGLAEEGEPSLTGIAALGTAHPDRHSGGLDVLRTLRGTDDPLPAYEAMQQSMQELAPDVVDFALGEVWTHPALDRKTRSLQVVAMLAALGGRPSALRSHMNGALNHGVSPGELVQTLRMVAVYAGFPAALEAWPVMEAVMEARGIERPRGAP